MKLNYSTPVSLWTTSDLWDGARRSFLSRDSCRFPLVSSRLCAHCDGLCRSGNFHACVSCFSYCRKMRGQQVLRSKGKKTWYLVLISATWFVSRTYFKDENQLFLLSCICQFWQWSTMFSFGLIGACVFRLRLPSRLVWGGLCPTL